MTYRQYYLKLVKDIEESEQFIAQRYKELKSDKPYLTKEEREVYMSLQNDHDAVLSRCERVAQLISSREVNQIDEIHADVLGFLPTVGIS